MIVVRKNQEEIAKYFIMLPNFWFCALFVKLCIFIYFVLERKMLQIDVRVWYY